MFKPFTVKKGVLKDTFSVMVHVMDKYGKEHNRTFCLVGSRKARSRANFLAMLLNAAWAFWVMWDRE